MKYSKSALSVYLCYMVAVNAAESQRSSIVWIFGVSGQTSKVTSTVFLKQIIQNYFSEVSLDATLRQYNEATKKQYKKLIKLPMSRRIVEEIYQNIKEEGE